LSQSGGQPVISDFINGKLHTSDLSIINQRFEKSSSTVSIKPGTIWNVEINADISQTTHRDISTSNTEFQDPSVTAGATCDYSNILKEIHYTFYTESTATFSKITSVYADVVYYDFKGYSCSDTDVIISQKYSYTFRDNDDDQDISFGYRKGDRIMAGKYTDALEKTIDAQIRGFVLQGADQDGHCLRTGTTERTKYYDDPVINF